jgi:hypothetical protein
MRRPARVSIALLMLGSAPPAWCDELSEALAREARSAQFIERGARTLPMAGFRFATAPSPRRFSELPATATMRAPNW